MLYIWTLILGWKIYFFQFTSMFMQFFPILLSSPKELSVSKFHNLLRTFFFQPTSVWTISGHLFGDEKSVFVHIKYFLIFFSSILLSSPKRTYLSKFHNLLRTFFSYLNWRLNRGSDTNIRGVRNSFFFTVAKYLAIFLANTSILTKSNLPKQISETFEKFFFSTSVWTLDTYSGMKNQFFSILLQYLLIFLSSILLSSPKRTYLSKFHNLLRTFFFVTKLTPKQKYRHLFGGWETHFFQCCPLFGHFFFANTSILTKSKLPKQISETFENFFFQAT